MKTRVKRRTIVKRTRTKRRTKQIKTRYRYKMRRNLKGGWGNLSLGGTQKEEEKEPLMNRQQMANELGVSLVTITDWMKKGLPFHRLNGRIYFLRSEVLKSMTHHHVKQ